MQGPRMSLSVFFRWFVFIGSGLEAWTVGGQGSESPESTSILLEKSCTVRMWESFVASAILFSEQKACDKEV